MLKRSLLVGGTIAAITLGGGSFAMAAAAPANSTGSESLAQKIADKFGLKATDVQSVIDQNRSDKEAQGETNAKADLAQAVKDGKLTQAQADHITSVMTQIDSLRAGKTPEQLDQSTRDKIKQLRQDLLQWAKDNKVNTKFVRGGGFHEGRKRNAGTSSSDSSASNSSTNSSSSSSDSNTNATGTSSPTSSDSGDPTVTQND